MRRALRFIAVALPVALATVPVALAGPDQATGRAPSAVDRSAAAADALRAAARQAKTPPPALIVAVDRGATVPLRSSPGGKVLVRLQATTEFGSPQRLGVVRRHGQWLGVSTPSRPNGRLGWIHSQNEGISVRRTRWRIVVDVSRRQIVLLRGSRAVRRLDVAVGRPGSPTPTGRFSVTDKVAGARFGPYYGCCILAISATQPNTPPGWTGGNRMAIHGTDQPGSIGAAASAGCLRGADSDLRVLMAKIPLGTPVHVRP